MWMNHCHCLEFRALQLIFYRVFRHYVVTKQTPAHVIDRTSLANFAISAVTNACRIYPTSTKRTIYCGLVVPLLVMDNTKPSLQRICKAFGWLFLIMWQPLTIYMYIQQSSWCKRTARNSFLALIFDNQLLHSYYVFAAGFKELEKRKITCRP